MKNYIPTYYAKNIYSIKKDFFLNNNISYVFCDLDNTLDAFDVLSPSENAIKLNEFLKENNIELVIISNNHSNRVKNYAKELGVRCLSSARKPFKGRLLKFVNQYNIDKNSVIMVGDQTVTDIYCANRSKIRSILVDKLVERDQPTTKFNRFFDKRIRKRLKKKNLLNTLEE